MSWSESVRSSFQPLKLPKVMVRLWEYQRYYPIAGWTHKMMPTDNRGRGAWINHSDGRRCEEKEKYELSREWKWNMDKWMPLIDANTDAQGWAYAIDPSMTWHAKKGVEHFVRRRLWQREKIARGGLIGRHQQGISSSGDEDGAQKSYMIFFDRLECFRRDLMAEEKDEELVSLSSATW